MQDLETFAKKLRARKEHYATIWNDSPRIKTFFNNTYEFRPVKKFWE